MTAYKGPVPKLEDLAKYDQVLPGSANRILTMAQQQAKHRQELEKVILYSGIKDSKRGQILGFVLVIVITILGFIFIMSGRRKHRKLGLIITVVGSIKGVLLYVRNNEGKEYEREDQTNS